MGKVAGMRTGMKMEDRKLKLRGRLNIVALSMFTWIASGMKLQSLKLDNVIQNLTTFSLITRNQSALRDNEAS